MAVSNIEFAEIGLRCASLWNVEFVIVKFNETRIWSFYFTLIFLQNYCKLFWKKEIENQTIDFARYFANKRRNVGIFFS